MALIEKLDPSVDLDAIRKEWLDIGLATGPDDVELRDRSIDLAYRSAGLDPPKIRISLRSPLEGAIGAHILAQVGAQVWDQVGAQVGAQVRAQVRAQVGAQVWDQVGAQVGDQVWAQVRDQVWDQVWAQVGDQVGAQVRDQVWAQVWAQVRAQVGAQVGDQVWAQVRDQVGAQVRDQVGAQVGAQVSRAGYGSHDAGWLGLYSAFRCHLGPAVSRLDGLNGIARSTGWWWPFRGAIILTPRPSELHMANGRLHRDGGASLSYPDGFSLYRLNGVSVPEWLAVNPATDINPAELPKIANAEVRREFVRKVGIERVLSGLNARIINSCGLYELLELDLGDGRRRPYLRMQNPSIDAVHIEGVHPNCKTVQEALNYRNGLGRSEIDDQSGVDWFQQGDVILRPRGAKKFKSRPKILT